MKNILKNSFWQLTIVYTIIILLVLFGFLSKYSLQFNILAIVIGIIGAITLKKEKKEIKLNKKLHYTLLVIGLLIILLVRIIPYFFTSVPLGYDPGLYKYGIEHGLVEKQTWILQGGMEPGFLYLMQPFTFLFSTDHILTYIFIMFCLLLGIAIYFISKEYFNKTTSLIAVFIYALSLIQFRAFWYLYYKNIIGMTTMLFAFYFLRKHELTQRKKFKWLFILFGALTGTIHRPTFYIFGLSYFIYAFVSPYATKKYNWKTLKENIISGVLILAISTLFYIGDFFQAITAALPWVAQGFVDPGQSPGTFINFFTYQYSILPYFIFATLGLLFCFRKKPSILAIWAILNLSIVYFQFFFFNRFIIMLDLTLILFASYGFYLMIENKKKLGAILAIILLLSLGIFAMKESINSKPLINEQELEAITQLSLTSNNSWVMSTSSYYSTWIQGYSERKTIAPGLFDYDNHSKIEWNTFWTTNNLSDIKTFMKDYEKPLYIFIGQRQKDNLAQFNNSNCFNLTYSANNNKIYNYLC